jgi:hypothetical protein
MTRDSTPPPTLRSRTLPGHEFPQSLARFLADEQLVLIVDATVTETHAEPGGSWLMRLVDADGRTGEAWHEDYQVAFALACNELDRARATYAAKFPNPCPGW